MEEDIEIESVGKGRLVAERVLVGDCVEVVVGPVTVKLETGQLEACFWNSMTLLFPTLAEGVGSTRSVSSISVSSEESIHEQNSLIIHQPLKMDTLYFSVTTYLSPYEQGQLIRKKCNSLPTNPHYVLKAKPKP